MSIRRRMTISLILALLLLLGGASAMLYGYVRAQLIRHFDDALLAKAQSLHALLRRTGTGGVDFDFSDDAMPEFNRSRSPEYFELHSARGSTLERSESLDRAELPALGTASAAPRFQDLRLPNGLNGRAVTIQVAPTTGEEGEQDAPGPAGSGATQAGSPYTLIVARERGGLDHTLVTLATASIGTDVVLACILGALMPWLVHRSLRPIGEIARKASEIDSRSLGNRFPVSDIPMELLPICTRLNDSLERLQGAFARERRFSADVAHELRTPISELRVLSEVALKFPQDSEAVRKSFQNALAIATHMDTTVRTLLEMIRSDAMANCTPVTSIDLVQSIERAWQALSERASSRRIMIRRNGEGAAHVLADEAITVAVFRNLLENAIDYSPDGAYIEWTCIRQDGRQVLELSNPAASLSASDVEHMAEPFWRKDASRTGDKHVGLGLALVKSYVQSMGGELRLELHGEKQLKITIEFIDAQVVDGETKDRSMHYAAERPA